jgi:hypothetical protein
MASTIFASNDLVGRGHMSGLSMRSICPLALMESDDRDPYHANELYAHGPWRIVPDFRWRPTAVRLKPIWPRATYCDLDMFWQF